VTISIVMIAVFLVACLGVVWWFFKTGYKIKK
jgi:ABC-2 type transport system permease protein